MDTISKLHIFSIGTVAANKPLDSVLIEVVPNESQNFLDGEITDNIESHDSTGKDADGSSYSTSVNSTASLQAQWLPIGSSNRKTSPDVRRGETVVIYRFGDTDKYYWTTLKDDLNLRKRETVIYAFSNTTDESVSPTADNTYYFEVSTHRKVITLHTAKSDSEPFAYDFQLDTKSGFFTFQDDAGNFIQLDSTNHRIELMNVDGSHIDMDRENITITAPDSINLIAGNNVNVQAGTNINSEAGSDINDKASTINTSSDSTNNSVPNTKFTGNINVGGLTTTKGLSSVSGGAFSVQGGGQFYGTVTVNGVQSSGVIHSDTAVTAPNIN